MKILNENPDRGVILLYESIYNSDFQDPGSGSRITFSFGIQFSTAKHLDDVLKIYLSQIAYFVIRPSIICDI